MSLLGYALPQAVQDPPLMLFKFEHPPQLARVSQLSY